jgi:hypothetical protein
MKAHIAIPLLLHVATDNMRDYQAGWCVTAARPDCGVAAWGIICERLDARSFARSLALLDNIMLRQRPDQSVTEYVHLMRQSFDDYKETCMVIDSSAAIHPHNLGLLMLRGISSSSQYGHAKPCDINTFDTNYFLRVNEVMASVLNLAQDMEDELPLSVDPAANPPALAPSGF